ncbi:unnamed protein product [Bubo scandiacus]
MVFRGDAQALAAARPDPAERTSPHSCLNLHVDSGKNPTISEKAEITSAKAASGQEHVLQERMKGRYLPKGSSSGAHRSEGLSRREVKPLGKGRGRSWRGLSTNGPSAPSPRPRAEEMLHSPAVGPAPAVPRRSHGQMALSAFSFPRLGLPEESQK